MFMFRVVGVEFWREEEYKRPGLSFKERTLYPNFLHELSVVISKSDFDLNILNRLLSSFS